MHRQLLHVSTSNAPLQFAPRVAGSNQITTAASILATLQRLNPDKVSTNEVAFTATMHAQEPEVGVTYFPPNNCDPTIVAPKASRQHLMMAAAVAPTLPAYFCWADADNVAQVKRWGKRDVEKLGEYTSPVFNQKTCGSCWAVASAGVFSDRWAIYTQGPNPQLSPTEILSCVGERPGAIVSMPNCNGCNGGIPAGAGAYFARVGTDPLTCVSYDWCNRDAVCSGRQASVGEGGDMLNSLIPRCGTAACSSSKYKGKFYTSTATPSVMSLAAPAPALAGTTGAFTVRQIDPNSSAALSVTGITDIQTEILANGPVVGAMAVFYDFQAGTLAGSGDWEPTKNVYCNVQGSEKRPYMGTRYGGTEAQHVGYHAVAVVGWGVEKDVDDWNNPGAKFDLPYWIVRNSWGSQWNSRCTVGNGLRLPGYFKIAWTDQRRNINTRVFLDNAEDGQLGGTTAFQPNVPRAAPPGKSNGQLGGEKEVMGYFFDGQLCQPTTDLGQKQYETAQECMTNHPAAQVALTYYCDAVKNKCVQRTDGAGAHATIDACTSACGKAHKVALGLIIGLTLLGVVAIALGLGLGLTRKK